MKATYLQVKKITDENNAILVAVSKTNPVSRIHEMYELGQRDFGENRVQELVEKAGELPADIRWHQIGHLQSNKVKYIAPFIHLIHAVDSLNILKEINKQAIKVDRIIPCLLQIHIAQEESKFGFSEAELLELLNSDTYKNLKNIQIWGLMGMATFTDDQVQVRNEFRNLRTLFERTKRAYFLEDQVFNTLSMGMSGDFELALEEGSTMVRVGSLLFGARQ
ncbi:MAG: YggS family pyridoxal phosphate-dependent enzyme [Saprospiraceae bacterium]|nr:YggS family pyridoxal phosphate-dependent enzyme [Saprospiraceae bacterium]